MIKLKIYLLILFSQHITPQDKLESIYRLEYTIQESEISCAIIAHETNYLEAYKLKINNSQKYNNILGFYYKKKYIKFKSYSECIKYYQRWQNKHWNKYHKKYPNKTYYDFLVYMPYCDKMKLYIKTIKKIQKQKLWK